MKENLDQMNLDTHEGKRLRQDHLWRFGIALVGFSLLAGVFLALADEVRERDTLGFDTAVLEAIRTVNSPFLDTVVLVVTNLASPIAVVAIMAGMVSLLLARHKRNAAFLVLTTIGGAAVLNVALKVVFQRARPDLWKHIIVESSYSFPSGHAMASAALAATLVALTWRTRYRWYVAGAGALYMIGIAFTRLYLGVHYPTDILAGWVVSIAWVVLVKALFDYFLERRGEPASPSSAR